MTKTVLDAINEQINAELSASYAYLAMSAYCQLQNFTGCAKWLRLQSDEEHTHAMKLLDFVLARQGKVELKAMTKPAGTFPSVPAVFEAALKQEQQVGRQNRPALRAGVQAEGLRRPRRAPVVHRRAGRGGEDGARDRRQVPDGQERLRVDARPRPRAGRAPAGRRRRAGGVGHGSPPRSAGLQPCVGAQGFGPAPCAILWPRRVPWFRRGPPVRRPVPPRSSIEEGAPCLSPTVSSRVRTVRTILLPALLVVAAPAFLASAAAQPAARVAAPEKTPTIEDKTAGMQKLDGYFPLYWDEQSGTLYMEILEVRHRRAVPSRACRPASARTTSASTAARAAAPRSCSSSGSGRRS